jgi:hypothetical protein
MAHYFVSVLYNDRDTWPFPHNKTLFNLYIGMQFFYRISNVADKNIIPHSGSIVMFAKADKS